jgi:glycosyltransferase involved in cell wall biosynthesis
MSRRINVLELRSVTGAGGGPEKTILVGAEQANRERFNVTVCYIRDARDGAYQIDNRAGAMAVDYVEITERHSFDRTVWPRLAALVRDRGIDIVHAHEYKTDLLALLLARQRGIVPLATAHGWTGQSARERLIYYPLDKRLLARYPHVLAVSSDIKHTLVRHGARPERITVVLNSIDPRTFRRDRRQEAAARVALGLTTRHAVVGAVGRLERQKRFDLLLEAFAALLPRRPELRLAVVGDGSLRDELASVARSLGVSDACVFAGHQNDIVWIHHAFDLFVQSSEYEGTPNAVLEAMAMETPIVATDVGGTNELIAPDVHGLIVPPHDVPALTTAMEAALDDPAAARARSDAARRRVEIELSFDARTRRLEEVYERLLSGSGPRHTAASPSEIETVRSPHA